MRPEFPGSFVQIHYHDRIGGVRRTMETYARTFAAIAGDAAPNLLVCSSSAGGKIDGCVTVDLPGADYHTFRMKQAYRSEVGRLTGKIHDVLTSPNMRYPVAVMGHNLNLGKNPALAAAFAGCARELGGAGERYRFYSVVHDFAEAGRSGVLTSLRKLQRMDKTVFRDLYATGAPVHYVVPDRFSAALTGLSSESVTVLPHPVNDAPVEPLEQSGVDVLPQRLRDLARGDGLKFDTGKTVYCYPSRLIYRKNGLEALLVATILTDGSLIVGQCGASTPDRKRYAAMVGLARDFGLSVAIDPSRLFGIDNAAFNDPFRLLYPMVHSVISTSIAEGYGYSLIEPWAVGIPVIGRDPSGIDLPRELTTGLYRRLPVPVSWVKLQVCHEYFRATYTESFGRHYRSLRAFTDGFVRDDTVDFGMLDTGQQTGIICRIMRNDGDRNQLKSSLDNASPAFPGLDRLLRAPGPACIRRNRAIVRGRNGSSFGNSFVNMLLRLPRQAASDWYQRIGLYYRNTGHFFPLQPPR